MANITADRVLHTTRYYERRDAYMVRARMVLYSTFNQGKLQGYEPSTVQVSPESWSPLRVGKQGPTWLRACSSPPRSELSARLRGHSFRVLSGRETAIHSWLLVPGDVAPSV